MDRNSDVELQTLMRRYQEGDQSAFRELYMRTSPGIERYLRRWSDSSRSGDLTQDTFLQIHRARTTYLPDMPLLPWMYAIARHVAMQALRTRGRREREVQNDEALIEATVESTEERMLARHDLAAAFAELSAEQREALWLSDVEGFSSGEIARITGVSEGAIRVRLHRARLKLKARLGREGTPS